jgi:hypothetical protein
MWLNVLPKCFGLSSSSRRVDDFTEEPLGSAVAPGPAHPGSICLADVLAAPNIGEIVYCCLTDQDRAALRSTCTQLRVQVRLTSGSSSWTTGRVMANHQVSVVCTGWPPCPTTCSASEATSGYQHSSAAGSKWVEANQTVAVWQLHSQNSVCNVSPAIYWASSADAAAC